MSLHLQILLSLPVSWGCGKEEGVSWGNALSGCDPLDFFFNYSRGLRPKTGLFNLVSWFLKITFLNLYPNLWTLSMPYTQIVFWELIWDNTYNSEANIKEAYHSCPILIPCLLEVLVFFSWPALSICGHGWFYQVITGWSGMVMRGCAL